MIFENIPQSFTHSTRNGLEFWAMTKQKKNQKQKTCLCAATRILTTGRQV